MQLRNLAIFIGLGLLAVSQCSDARHSMRERRDTEYDDFAADEADGGEPQNDELYEATEQRTPEPKNQPPEVPVRVTTPAKIYEVKKGEDVSLECQVEPENVTVVTQWYKGSNMYYMNTMKTFFDTDLSRYFVAPDSKNLNIKAVQASDAGLYRCVVVRMTPVSVEHSLVVLEPPQINQYTASNGGNVAEGQDLLLTCEVIGKPPPQIIWSRTRVSQDGNERLSETDGEFTHNSLFMRGVRRELSGMYYCYACNGLGCDQKELQVNVTGKPHVHVHKNVINSAIGVEAVLECSTRYDAKPHIRWYKDGKLIEDSSTDYVISTRGTFSNLTVTPDADDDFGTFTCEAENAMGRHNRSIELVQRPVVEALQAEDGRLAWTVRSHRPLQELRAQIQQQDGNGEWKEFAIPLPSTSSHSYALTFDLNDKQLEAGKYQAVVKALNDHSWSDNIDPVIVEIEVQPSMSIQTASVFRGNSAHSIQGSAVLSTALMYLLVRMV